MNRYYLPLCFSCRVAIQARGYDIIRKATFSQEVCAVCGNVGPYGITEVTGEKKLETEGLIRPKFWEKVRKDEESENNSS